MRRVRGARLGVWAEVVGVVARRSGYVVCDNRGRIQNPSQRRQDRVNILVKIVSDPIDRCLGF